MLVAELRDRRPDAVAFDSNARWGRMATVSLELPTISFMTTMLLGAADFSYPTAREWVQDPAGQRARPARHVGRQAASAATLRRAALLALTVLAPFEAT